MKASHLYNIMLTPSVTGSQDLLMAFQIEYWRTLWCCRPKQFILQTCQHRKREANINFAEAGASSILILVKDNVLTKNDEMLFSYELCSPDVTQLPSRGFPNPGWLIVKYFNMYYPFMTHGEYKTSNGLDSTGIRSSSATKHLLCTFGTRCIGDDPTTPNC